MNRPYKNRTGNSRIAHNPMPNAWPLVPLGRIIRQQSEFIRIDDLETYKRVRVQLHAKGIVLRDIASGAEIKTKRQQVCRAGEFLVAEIDAKVGGFGIVPYDLAGAIVSSHYFLFELADTAIDRRFLDFFVRTPSFQDQVHAQGSTNYAAIRPADVLDYTIPLPPLDEQRRIVARIEALAAKIEEARHLRQHAFGELQLIVSNARSELFNEFGKSLTPVRLDSVSDCRLGKMLSEKAKTGMAPTPYVRNANIQWDRLDLSSIFEMDFHEEERKTFALQSGDILVCEGGDIGKAAVWNGEIPGCCYQKALHRVRVHPQEAVPRFILHHIFWAAEQGHFTDIKTQTTIAHLTGVKLKAYGVLIPDLPQQRRIVAYLDGLKTKADALKKLQSETTAELDALLPSILDKAFKGEL